MDQGVLEWAKDQAVGAVFGMVILIAWLKDKRATEKLLVGVLRERKADRDKLLIVMGRIEGHLARADAFEEFSRAALDDTLRPDVPKRRRTDRLLLAAFQRELETAQAAGADEEERNHEKS